jgi:hypothetical protein
VSDGVRANYLLRLLECVERITSKHMSSSTSLSPDAILGDPLEVCNVFHSLIYE